MKSDLVGRVLAQAGKVVESRSSVLVSLQWKIIILLFFLLAFVAFKAALWIEVGIFALLVLVVTQSCFSFHYFMKKNPDALRSEKHAISKYAIDKGLYGDSDAGMYELPKLGSNFVLTAEAESLALDPTKAIGRKIS